MMKRLLCLLLYSCFVWVFAYATPTTEGTEFWATFLRNHTNRVGSSEMTLEFIVSSRENATITVQNPQTGWRQSFSVSANQIAKYTIPHNQGYTYDAGVVEKRGLKVTSTAPVSLYASNYVKASYDASIVLPTTALGKDYIIQVFENELYSKEFAIVATTNNTTVTITPHARTTDGHIKHVPYTITLNAGDTYQVMSSDGGSDFSGTRIESNYPIAVFAGHQCINVPTGNPWCDHIVEQQMPTPMWGKQFAITKTSRMKGDRVMITAKEDNTIVRINGVQQTVLKALDSHTFRLTDNSTFVETSAPASCYLYIEGARDNNMLGDPSCVHISPIEQRIQDLTFSTFETDRSRSHYVNLVTTATGAETMTLDGVSIADKFIELKGNNMLRYAQINIAHGTHTLHSSQDGFVGHVYGLGKCESYAYTIGSATIPLDGNILLNGVPHADMEYSQVHCYREPVLFSPHSNVEFTSIMWDFGDGVTSNQKTVSHTYAAPGTYRVSMTITNTEGQDIVYTTLHLTDLLRDTVYTSICEGDTYSIGGKDYAATGKYDVTLSSVGGCDSIVTLYLTVNDTSIVQVIDSFHMGASYRWHGNWYKTAGVYRDTLLSKSGCDSIIELTLIQTDPTEVMHDTICWQENYTFKGNTFHLPSYESYQTDSFMNVVLEYRDRVACKKYKMKLAIVPMEDGQSRVVYDTIMIGDTYDFYGEILTEAGTYYKAVNSACDCTIDYTLHLTVLTMPLTPIDAMLCHEDTYTFRGKIYDEEGVYYDTVYNVFGIDSIYKITLTDARTYMEYSVSGVSSYVFNGTTYTESGTYTAIFTNAAGCDSIVTLHLGIGEPCVIQTEEQKYLCDGESVIWNGQTCLPGNAYTATFTSAGGCDSIVTLHLNKLETKSENLSVSICQGDFYKIGEERLSEEGDYTIRLTAAAGCDSIVNLHLSFNESWADTTFATINIGEEYIWEGDVYTTEGTYAKGCIATNGCDSLQVLCLNVDRDCLFSRDTNIVLCYGESIVWYDSTYASSGKYQQLLHYSDRCDTLVTMNLTILPQTITETEKVTIADNDLPYTWRGIMYNAAGQYTDIVKYTAADCDSAIYVLDLTVLTTGTVDEQSVTICDSEAPYVWYDQSYSVTGKYTHTEQYAGTDIDSIQHILNLTVNSTIYIEEIVAACDAYIWNGQTYTQSGEYVYSTIAANGCDSIVTLHLTINYSEVAPVEYVTLCYGETYTWNGQTYSTAGEYSVTLSNANGCDSVATLHLTIMPAAITTTETVVIGGDELPYIWRGNTYIATGLYTEVEQYATAADCDSAIYVLDLTVLTTGTVDEQSVTICDSETPYVWYDQSLTAAGKYIYTEQYAGTSIDSVHHILNLTVSPTTYGGEEITIVFGETYHWNGKDYDTSGEYIDTLQNIYGCDSVVTLKLTVLNNQVNLRDILIKEQCADENMVEIIIDVEGQLDSVGLSFDKELPNIISSGLYDTIVPMPMDGNLSIPYTNIRAGQYNATLAGYCYQRMVFSEHITLTFLYPSTVLEQRWNDVIVVLADDYNGGYNFTDFQWYKDGKELAGETHSYLNQPLEMGCEYSALLTQADGTQLMTCPIVAVEHTDMTLYPTIANRLQQLCCKVSMNAQFYLYDAMGKLCNEMLLNQGDNYFEAPRIVGVYLAKIVLLTGEEKNIKILVM